ncbi:hypothetical protein GCM10009718_02290 [Isoptericola halotolerans]|uniref:DUF4439 domain-containing protein n=1 Tax=Isoptericola halotolerans TaxID=300560 RepID=A0ABX2A228_9MICO|nr:DUF4439 domain-containing protein [Isoptericola halotolerans]NOV96844.1 hypothetical protein [Isoptericola halotolerans]
MEPHPTPAPATRRRGRVAVVGLVVAVVLSGCGLRLETPPPGEPVPDTIEIVRRTAVSDALYVAELAEVAIDRLDGRRPRLTAELERVATESREQADELGGEYDSGLEPEGSPESSPETSADEERTSLQDVVDALVDASGRSRTAAGTTGDGPLARLLASVGAAQAVSARRVVEYVDGDLPPPVVPVVPRPAEIAPGDEEEDDSAAEPSDDAASALSLLAAPAEVEPSDEPSEDVAPDGISSTVPDSDEPAVVPRGLTASDLRTLVESEDSAGYALRLRAALTSGDERERLADRADQHTARAQAWADVAGTSRTDQDPRQVAYAVPREPGDAALVRAVENDLATGYATLIGTTAPSTRAILVDLLVESAVVLDDWGADPVPFPGLPEQQD